MASLILGTVGETLLGSIGGFLGSTIGSIIDAYLFTPDPEDVEGPRLEDTDAAAADPGTPIPVVFGAERVGGIVIHNTEIKETKYEEEQKAGKKSYSYITHTYSITLDLLVGEGPILGIGRMWADGKLIRGERNDWVADSQSWPFRVGGFRYPDWYFGTAITGQEIRIFDPAVAPWHNDPAQANNPGPDRWILLNNGTGELYVPTPNSLQELFADNANVIWYWKDQDTNYFLPYYDDIEYVNEEWPNKHWIGYGVYASYGDWERTVEWLKYLDGSPWSVDLAQGNTLPYGDTYADRPGIFNLYSGEQVLNVDARSIGPSIPSPMQTFTIPDDPTVQWVYQVPINFRGETVVGYPTWYSSGPVYSPGTTKFGKQFGGGIVGVGVHLSTTWPAGGGTPAGTDSCILLSGQDNNFYYNGQWQYTGTYQGTLVYRFPIGMMYPDSIHPLYAIEPNEAYIRQRNIDQGKSYFTCKWETSCTYQIAGGDPKPIQNPKRFTGTIEVYAIGNEEDNEVELLYSNAWECGVQVSLDPAKTSGDVTGRIPPGTRSLEYRIKLNPYEIPIASGQIGGTGGTYGPGDATDNSVSFYFNLFDIELFIPSSGAFPEIRDWDDYYNLYAAVNDFSPLAVLQFRNPDDFKIYRGTNDQPSDAIMTAANNDAQVPAYRGRAHLVFDNMQLEDYGNRVPNITVEVIHREDDEIRTVIAALFARAGLDGTYFDVTALPQDSLPTSDYNAHVPGFATVRRTSIAKALEALMGAFWVDAAEIQDKIVFRPNIRVADHVIDFDKLSAHDADNKQTDVNIVIQSRDQLTLPRAIEVLFHDLEREYMDNGKRYIRTQAPTDHTASVQIPMVMYPFVMAAWSRKKMQDIWRGKLTVKFSLPPEYIYVSPTDIVTIVTDKVIGTDGGIPVTATFDIKVTNVRRGANGVLDVEGVIWLGALYPVDDYASFNTENQYINWNTWAAVGHTWWDMIDIPHIREHYVVGQNEDTAPTFAVSNTLSPGWRGADILKLEDGEYNRVGGSTANSSVMGIVETTISNTYNWCTVEPNTYIPLTILTGNPSWSSATIDEMFELKNLALVGEEIVSFTTITDYGGGYFEITGPCIRGLHNSLTNAHVNQELFCLLEQSKIVYEDDYDVTTLGNLERYKAVSLGLSEVNAVSQQYTYTGRKFLPFPPTMLTGTRDGLDNLTIDWVRQDRVFTNWEDYVDLPNTEPFERYEIDVFPDANYNPSDVLRTIYVDEETTALYTAAQQVTDLGSSGNTVYIAVYQIGRYGRGLPHEGAV